MIPAGLLFLSPPAAVVEAAWDPNGPAIEHVGGYENWRSPGEHPCGYGQQFWKQGDELDGLLRMTEVSVAGDIPVGRPRRH